MTELRRAAIRILANYMRLFAVVCLGILLVRLLLSTLGVEVVGLFNLIANTAGIAMMVEEVVGWSMIRELGAAHHSGDPKRFKSMYNTACIVSGGASMLTLAMFGILLALLPLLAIPEDLLPAARWFVIAKAIESVFVVSTAPQFNMYLVMERMVAYNAWYVAKRGSMVAAALSLFWIQPADPAAGLIWFGCISSGLHILLMAGATVMIMALDRRLILAPSSATRSDARSILGISGCNIAILGSQMLGSPAGAILMNLAFGLVWNTIYGIATQLGGYTRMFTSGMTGGLDAVSARLSTTTEGGSESKSMHALIRHSTRLHGIVAFPAALITGVLAEPLLHIWVGGNLDSASVHYAAVLVRILLIAFVSICVGDNWLRILYGAGHIRRYALLVMVGGVVNLGLACVLLMVAPESVRYTSVAVAFSTSLFVFQVLLVPRVVDREFGITYGEVLMPLVRPLLVALAATPALAAFCWLVPQWNVIWLLAAVSTYGVIYSTICWAFVLQRHERSRLLTAVARLGLLPAWSS